MPDETIIAGNPAVLRMKFERDGCKVTATALDIGEMPYTHYMQGYTVQRCGTAATAVITGNIISINPNGEPNAYAGAGSTTYISVELAQSAMHGLAAAVDEMGRVHAPKPHYAQTAEPQPECTALYAETDRDFALRMLRECYTRTVIYPMSAAWMQRGRVQTSVADAIRLATLIGGAS